MRCKKPAFDWLIDSTAPSDEPSYTLHQLLFVNKHTCTQSRSPEKRQRSKETRALLRLERTAFVVSLEGGREGREGRGGEGRGGEGRGGEGGRERGGKDRGRGEG